MSLEELVRLGFAIVMGMLFLMLALNIFVLMFVWDRPKRAPAAAREGARRQPPPSSQNARPIAQAMLRQMIPVAAGAPRDHGRPPAELAETMVVSPPRLPRAAAGDFSVEPPISSAPVPVLPRLAPLEDDDPDPTRVLQRGDLGADPAVEIEMLRAAEPLGRAS
jgi:hypothetical protein